MPAPDPTAIDVAPDAEIGQKLKRAKAAGAAVRARISVTMGLAGGALVAVLVAAAGSTPSSSAMLLWSTG